MKPCSSHGAFALLDLLVSMSVLGVLMMLTLQLFNSTLFVTSMGNQRMDTDAQARAVFDRMALDLEKMIKRPDIDYYLKFPETPQRGNDQLAFYSQLPGYYPPLGPKSPFSLVAYRINADSTSGNPYYQQLQRFGCGLLWNGLSYNDTPMVFLPCTISNTWPNATSLSAADTNFELLGPQVFRMEYYYIIKGQTLTTGETYPSHLSDTPWDDCIPDHVSVEGLRDVAAITVVIAVISPKSRAMISDAQLTNLAAAMPDFSNTMKHGELEAQWQSAINAPNSIPRNAASGIRIYRRCFYLSPP